jgi:hypothetical protein
MHKGPVCASALALLVLALVAACGTASVGAGDGGAPDAAERGCSSSSFPTDGTACTERGLVCPGPATPCAFNPLCPSCAKTEATCGEDGRWRVVTTSPSCPDLCPSIFPKSGDPCTTPDVTCGRPMPPCASVCECSNLIATCRGGAWEVVDQYSPPDSCFVDGGSDGGRDASPRDATGD